MVGQVGCDAPKSVQCQFLLLKVETGCLPTKEAIFRHASLVLPTKESSVSKFWFCQEAIFRHASLVLPTKEASVSCWTPGHV